MTRFRMLKKLGTKRRLSEVHLVEELASLTRIFRLRRSRFFISNSRSLAADWVGYLSYSRRSPPPRLLRLQSRCYLPTFPGTVTFGRCFRAIYMLTNKLNAFDVFKLYRHF